MHDGLGAYNALWFLPRTKFVHRRLGVNTGTLEAILWVISCVMSCFCFHHLQRLKGNPPRKVRATQASGIRRR